MRMTTATFYVSAVLALGACSDDAGPLFQPKPECKGEALEPFAGSNTQVISKLAIGAFEDGFDLDGDGKPDNKLGGVSDVARKPIEDALKNYEVVIPMELFDVSGLAEDECVKFGVYLGDYAQDTDGDGAKTAVDAGDCNDKDMTVNRGVPEVAGDFKDNNCNGLADEDGANPSTDPMDRDMDGQSVAAGDCDDTNAAIKKGSAEICGDGFDNDCDGSADRSGGAEPTACNPYVPAHQVDVAIDPLSFDGGAPVIAFKDGVISKQGAGFRLDAGPSVFGLSLPVQDGIALELKITGATIQADVEDVGGTVVMKNGRLGGVLDAKTADTIRGLTVDLIKLKPEDSLLDVAFANILGTLISLPKAEHDILLKYEDCRTPDIDVDQDGLEAYCDTDINDEKKTVDICIDGDGTEIADVVGGDGKVTMHCTEAVKGDKPRFVDGISVVLTFDTSPIKSIKRQ